MGESRIMSPYLILIFFYVLGHVSNPFLKKTPTWLLSILTVAALGLLIFMSATTPAAEYATPDVTRSLIYIVAFWAGGTGAER